MVHVEEGSGENNIDPVAGDVEILSVEMIGGDRESAVSGGALHVSSDGGEDDDASSGTKELDAKLN